MLRTQEKNSKLQETRKIKSQEKARIEGQRQKEKSLIQSQRTKSLTDATIVLKESQSAPLQDSTVVKDISSLSPKPSSKK